MGCMVWRDQEQLESAQGTLRGRLVGCSPRGHKQPDMTERLSTHTRTHTRTCTHTHTHSEGEPEQKPHLERSSLNQQWRGREAFLDRLVCRPLLTGEALGRHSPSPEPGTCPLQCAWVIKVPIKGSHQGLSFLLLTQEPPGPTASLQGGDPSQ